jgi:hypothetical protein
VLKDRFAPGATLNGVVDVAAGGPRRLERNEGVSSEPEARGCGGSTARIATATRAAIRKARPRLIFGASSTKTRVPLLNPFNSTIHPAPAPPADCYWY